MKLASPSWKHDCDGIMRATTPCVRSWLELMNDGSLRLPAFQRPWVWSDAQVARFIESIIHGYHVGTLLLWHRMASDGTPMGSFGELQPVGASSARAIRGVHLVIDGQQRLGALATASVAGRFKLDLRDATVHVSEDELPWHVSLPELLSKDAIESILDGAGNEHAHRHGLDRSVVVGHMVAAANALGQSTGISAIEIPERWSLDRVVESFKRLNVEGTRMDPEDLRNGLSRSCRALGS